jgi:ribonuclease HII
MRNNKIVGIDEAGRGPLAGPVVAAAVILPYDIDGLNDSKKLSKLKREYLFAKIIEISNISIGIADVQEIDNINILQATMLAMQRAYEGLTIGDDYYQVLVDGNKAPNINCPDVKTIIGGDALQPAISAASIIAKVTRDKIMKDLDQEYPQYLWKKNAGYGTKEHLLAISNFGITKHHRLSFAPVNKHSIIKN